jgi:hypothetical protein
MRVRELSLAAAAKRSPRKFRVFTAAVYCEEVYQRHVVEDATRFFLMSVFCDAVAAALFAALLLLRSRYIEHSLRTSVLVVRVFFFVCIGIDLFVSYLHRFFRSKSKMKLGSAQNDSFAAMESAGRLIRSLGNGELLKQWVFKVDDCLCTQ